MLIVELIVILVIEPFDKEINLVDVKGNVWV